MFSQARWRLTLWFAGAFAIILIVIGGAVYFTARQSLLDQVKGDLQRQGDAVVAAQQFDPQGNDPNRRRVTANSILGVISASGSFYVILDEEGKFVDSSESINAANISLPPTDTIIKDATGPKSGFHHASTTTGEQLRLVARPINYSPVGSQAVYSGYVEIGRSIEPQLKSLRRLLIILFGGGVVGLGLAAAGGYWLAGRALKPIRATMESQRAFVADASHELRTPLSLIRANAEMMQRHPEATDPASVEDIIKETDRLAYLVSQLLTLARSDSADAPLEKTSVDVNQLAGDIARQMKLLADEKQIVVNVQTDGAATVSGDEQRLGELLLILLDNSIKYTDSGGHVDVNVQRSNGRVQIAVSDNGVGIPRASLPHVFDRFYRVDKARSREIGGSGLGLAIARWIAEKHDGRIAIDSEEGRGTKVTVDLPAA